MKSIESYFTTIIKTGIRESLWFRSAPLEYQKTAKISIICVDNRKFYGLGTSAVRPCIVAECECGGEIQRFSLLLDNTETLESIN